MGYGFPIGGVAAFDLEEGIISPGGIGFDINCGMRLITTNLSYKDVQPRIKELIDHLFMTVPAGVGKRGTVEMTVPQFKEMMTTGVKWCVENGLGWDEDLDRIEEHGCIKGADPDKVSDKAINRGIRQLGTLGSGNHYLEAQITTAESIFDEKIAKAFGITFPDQVVVMVHCGSRGFGHQVATDFLKVFERHPLLVVLLAKHDGSFFVVWTRLTKMTVSLGCVFKLSGTLFQGPHGNQCVEKGFCFLGTFR